MNHARSIKEMLSIPTGSSRNVATSGYSSFTDSQVFFGSQFWPENSQGSSQDMSMSSRTSSSQEGSDPKFLSSYHTKPLLFGELKDKNKAFGILEAFEEDKKRAKEKADSDILAKECHHFRETLNNIQQLVAGTERNTAVCQTVLEKFDNFVSTLQNNLNSLQSNISQQFETLLNKVNSQKGIITELEERVQKSGDSTSELTSNLQSLKNSLECLTDEQEKERNMLEEALKLLTNLVSEHSAKPNPQKVMDSAVQTSPAKPNPQKVIDSAVQTSPAKPNPQKVMDSAVQTSPGLEKPLSNSLEDNKLESTQLTCMSLNLERNQAQDPLQDHRNIIAKRKVAMRGHRMRKKRPLVLSQRGRHTAMDENSQPLMNCNRQQKVSVSVCKRRNMNMVTSQNSLNLDCQIRPNRGIRSEAAGCVITPLSCWSQDSNSPVCISGIEPILEKLSKRSPEKPQGLWQLFDMDSDSVLDF